jgi:hypothetical protein
MSNLGTNDYNALELVPDEVIVSRTLQSKNRFWTNIIWRPGKPALDSEWNLSNDIAIENISNLTRSITPSGWLDLGENVFPAGNSNISNNFQYYSNSKHQILDIPNAIVNGWPIIVGGVNYPDTSINSITLDETGTTIGTQRYDFVFLEVWKAQVRSRDPNNIQIAQNKPSLTEIYAYGNLQYGGSHFLDDIVDPAIKPSTDGIETSERVQIQYKVRIVKSVSFSNCLSSGFEDIIKVQGQGANVNSQVANYQFVNMKDELNDSGLWRCGNGDEASRTALRTVDGYSYAIPMFKVFRRTKVFYNDTGVSAENAYNNQQSNFASLTDLISDRPDNKFYDGIDDTDILDLRTKISLNGFDYNQIIEKNLHSLLMGNLESVKKPILQYDSISDSDVYGYSNFTNDMGCNGKRTVWSDAITDQIGLFGKVSITTTSPSYDVYVIKISGSNWVIGDQVVIQSTIKLPVGTIVKSIPKIYVEEKVFGSNITELIPGTDGHWSGLNTSTAIFTFDVNKTHGKNLWVYYDITLPIGQGISYVPNQLNQVKYANYSSFGSGTVVRGEILTNLSERMLDLADHVFENISNSVVFKETEFMKERKQVTISPLIQTTSSRNGVTRTLDTKTTNVSAKQLYVPFPIQHLRGVYTAASGGTEIATQEITDTQPTSVDITENSILISENYFIAEITSLRYDPTGSFSGSEQDLITLGYKPVFTHRRTIGLPIGSIIKLYDVSGNIFIISSGTTAANFRWFGRKIRSRGGAGYGYDIDEQMIDCTASDNNGLFAGFTDGQQLWIDMDYLGAPHQGAEIRLIYEHTPYQGFDVGGQTIQLIQKREKGLFFNNGTGGGNVEISVNGTSNFLYTPISTKLPGVFQDYLRDGQSIDIVSKGVRRFDSDTWFSASYDCYGYYGGGSIWTDSFLMPTDPETTTRGFLSTPMLEVIFELPTSDQTYAEFVLVLLVKNKETNELYLLVQIGNHGNHASGIVNLELYRLNEKLLTR